MKWTEIKWFGFIWFAIVWDEVRWDEMPWYYMQWSRMIWYVIFLIVVSCYRCFRDSRLNMYRIQKPSSSQRLGQNLLPVILYIYIYVYIYICIWDRLGYTWTSDHCTIFWGDENRGWSSRLPTWSLSSPSQSQLSVRLIPNRLFSVVEGGALSSVAAAYYHRHERCGRRLLDQGADAWCWMSCSDISFFFFHPKLIGFKGWFFRKLRDLWHWVEMNQVFVCPRNS